MFNGLYPKSLSRVLLRIPSRDMNIPGRCNIQKLGSHGVLPVSLIPLNCDKTPEEITNRVILQRKMVVPAVESYEQLSERWSSLDSRASLLNLLCACILNWKKTLAAFSTSTNRTATFATYCMIKIRNNEERSN